MAKRRGERRAPPAPPATPAMRAARPAPPRRSRWPRRPERAPAKPARTGGRTPSPAGSTAKRAAPPAGRAAADRVEGILPQALHALGALAGRAVLQALAGSAIHATPERTATPMPLLKFDNVSKRYPGGQAALRELSFAVEPGEMLFVTGHSGAGKSTLLRAHPPERTPDPRHRAGRRAQPAPGPRPRRRAAPRARSAWCTRTTAC